MPSARVVVQPRADGRQDAELFARGGTELGPDRSLVGRLGPTKSLEVCWSKPVNAAVKSAQGIVEGLLLWDVNPAGDRVRARFTIHQTRKLSTFRFTHQKGLILRSAHVSGSVDTRWEEDAAREEWILSVDPPLQAGSTIALDCWLPLDEGQGAASSRPTAELVRGRVRSLPRLEPERVERYTGSLGVRRPGDWTGRFDPLPGTDPISDESFVEAWGSLPEEPFTLCGTSRFVRECRAALPTGPALARIHVKPTIQVQIESGRIAITLQAELTQLAGHLRHAEVTVPEDIEIIEVIAEGLSDWTISADHHLRMVIERPISRAKRHLRVFGWIPLREDPLQLNARQHHVKTPWFWWDGVETGTGFLTIASIAKPEVRGSAGLSLVSSESSGAGGAITPSHRFTYRIDDPRKLGEIFWESVPPRVSVAIESQIAIHPDSAEWVAVLRYDVIGGALDAIHLKMPAVWAAGAAIQLAGNEYQLTTETRGPDAFWTITPERLIWGSQRFVLRSSRRLESEERIVHPEITPLGRGAVLTYVGIINATGRPLTTENVVGLQPIPFHSRFQAREFATVAGTPAGAYRVTRDSWLLRVQAPRSTSQEGSPGARSARLAFADIMVVIMPDRASLGRAVYDTIPGTGAVLSFDLPADSSLLSATVDSSPAIPLRSPSGKWTVACDDRRRSRVGLIWSTNPVSPRSTSSKWAMALPRAGAGATTTLVSVYTPPGVTINQGDHGGLEPSGVARLEMARADWIAHCAGDLIAKIDRSSGRDHEKLVSLLINHEMALRGALRNVQRSEPGGIKVEVGQVEHDLALIRLARASRDEAVQKAGLEEDLKFARIYLGEIPANPTGPPGGVPEPSATDRIRYLGRPFTFMGVIPGIDAASSNGSLILETRPWDTVVVAPRDQSVVTIFVLIGILVVTTPIGRLTWPSSVALVAALGLAGFTGGPLVLALGLGLAVAGWKNARG